jgi:K+-transporting ATPase c subunit
MASNLFPYRANGILRAGNGKIVGSELIKRNFIIGAIFTGSRR